MSQHVECFMVEHPKEENLTGADEICEGILTGRGEP